MLLMLPLGCRIRGFLHHADALITSCQDVHLQCLQAQYGGALAAATAGKSEVEYVVTGVLPRPAGAALVDDWDCLRVRMPLACRPRSFLGSCCCCRNMSQAAANLHRVPEQGQAEHVLPAYGKQRCQNEMPLA